MKKLLIILLFIPIIISCFDYRLKKDINKLTKAIELDPHDSDNYYFRGRVKEELKDYKGAIEDYTKAIELIPNSFDPNYSDFFYTRGLAKEKLGYIISKDEKGFSISEKTSIIQYIGAIIDFTKAIELNPNEASYYAQRGNASNYIEDYKGGIVNLNKAIELDPNNGDYYGWRGRSNYGLGDLVNACKDWEKSLELTDFTSEFRIKNKTLREKFYKLSLMSLEENCKELENDILINSKWDSERNAIAFLHQMKNKEEYHWVYDIYYDTDNVRKNHITKIQISEGDYKFFKDSISDDNIKIQSKMIINGKIFFQCLESCFPSEKDLEMIKQAYERNGIALRKSENRFVNNSFIKLIAEELGITEWNLKNKIRQFDTNDNYEPIIDPLYTCNCYEFRLRNN